jgi:hypothetical protein
MEKIVELSKTIEIECRGIRRFNRAKIQEQLAAQQSAATSPQQDTHDLDDALCFVLGFQKIILDDIHKRILHFPKEFSTWSKERPVWTTALGSRCIFHLPGEIPLSEGLGTWMMAREAEGWRIQWPIHADMKLEEIKEKCRERNIKPSGEKPLKDDWCALLSRSDAITHLLRTFH